MAESYDAIVIGTGQAGPPLAVRLGHAGRKTAIIERKLIGGTCVNVGCIPTKTLIASARAAHIAHRAADFGVVLDGPARVDMARVKARKDAIVAQSNASVAKWIRQAPNVTLIEGQARFEGPRSVRVGERLLEASRIFINVGGRAAVRGIDGLADVRYFTNSGMMDIDRLPEHLVIVGGSYIGLEFAQMYRRFGSAVTVVEMGPRLIGREDEDISAAIQAILEAEGIKFRLNATCLAAAPEGNGVSVRISCREEPRAVAGSHLLLAIGDVNGRGAFTHTSYNDYEIVAANLLDGEQRRVSDRIPTYALFIDPPLGRVGMTEREVRASGRRALKARRMMTRVGRARERSETQGFMEVLVDAETKKILGAAVLGIEGDEAVHCILDLMAAGAPYTVLQRAMHIHPTVSELLPTLLGDLEPLS
jgi:pyruvate/2-oxoglutarate dehydrogenase complex dihydrolipoamide dehydrogenase (E3) component